MSTMQPALPMVMSNDEKNRTVFERYTPEDIQRATERAEQFLEAFRSDSNGRTDVTTEELQPLARMLAMYDLRMLEQMFDSTQGEL